MRWELSFRRQALGAALDSSEDLADALTHTTASIFAPGIIGGLSRSDHPTRNLNRDGPYPFYWTARCFSDSACFVLQAAFFRSRNSLSTSSGVRYPRAE